MKARAWAAIVAVATSSVSAATLTISGEVEGLTLRYEGAQTIVVVAPHNAVLEFVPEDLADFSIVPTDDGQRHVIRARFSGPVRFRSGRTGWTLSDEASSRVAASPEPAPLPDVEGEAPAMRATSSEVPRQRNETGTESAPVQSNTIVESSSSEGTEPDRGSTQSDDERKSAGKPPVGEIGDARFTLAEEGAFAEKKFTADISVPESPAAAVIGNAPTLIRLNDAKDGSTQLLNFIDDDGNLRSGFSVAFHPYRMLARPTLTQYAYGINRGSRDEKNGRWVRFMSRLDLSLAATVDEPKEGTTTGATLAAGLSGYIFNNADARLMLSQRLVDAFQKNNPFPGTGPIRPRGSGGVIAADEVDSDQVKAITEEVFASVWNNSYWAFGFAPRWRSATGDTGDFKSDGGAAWTTFAYGFEGAGSHLGCEILEDKSQLLLHASYRDRLQVTDPADATKQISEDRWVAAAQLRFGAKNLNIFGEYVWERHKPFGRGDYTTEAYFVGLERRMADNLWLQISVGSKEEEGQTDNAALIRTALNYAFGDSVKSNGPAK